MLINAGGVVRTESSLNEGLTGWHQMARGRAHQHAAFSERNIF